MLDSTLLSMLFHRPEKRRITLPPLHFANHYLDLVALWNAHRCQYYKAWHRFAIVWHWFAVECSSLAMKITDLLRLCNDKLSNA